MCEARAGGCCRTAICQGLQVTLCFKNPELHSAERCTPTTIKTASKELTSSRKTEGEDAGGGRTGRCFSRRLGKLFASWLQLLKEQEEGTINVASISSVTMFLNNN